MSIVWCHCMENNYHMGLDGFRQLSPIKGFMRDLIYTGGRLGVPVFIMLSGYLLISRHPCSSPKDFLRFYRTKWWPLLRCWWLWIALYALFAFLYWGHFDLRELLDTLIFQKGPYAMSHVWYMPMIIGLYLMIPFYSAIFHRLGHTIVLLMAAFCVLKSVILPLLEYHGSWDLASFGDCYNAYILLGAVAIIMCSSDHERGLCRIFIKASPFLAVTAIIWIGSYYYNAHARQINIGLWYSEPRLIIASFLIFMGCRNLRHLDFRLVSWLSRAAFTIYLIHNPIIYLIVDHTPIKNVLPRSLSTVALWMITMLLSCAVVAVLQRSATVRRYLLLMK